MENKSYNKKRLRNASLALVVIFVLLVLSTVLGWGAASGWGSVSISRVQFVGEGGAAQSGLIFVPKGVNQENPAPAIINFHGRNNSSYNLVTWGIEEARRGYVVFNPDLAGTLETETTDENNTAALTISAYKYLNALDMVSEISVTGHSMGNLSLQIIGAMEEHAPKLNSMVGVGGAFFWNITQRDFPTMTNYAIIEGSADLFVKQFLGSYDNLHALVQDKSGLGNELDVTALDEVHGSFDDGTAFKYAELPKITHQWMLYSKDTTAQMLDFINESSPAPIQLDSNDMVFPTYLAFSAISFVLFILFIVALGYTLTSLPLVYNILNVPLEPSLGKSKPKWLLQAALDILVPIALFVPVTRWIVSKEGPLTKVFVSTWVNQIMFWLFAGALVSGVIITIRSLRKRKTQKLTPLDFGTGVEGEKIIDWKRIGVAAAIGVAVAFVAFTWMDIVFRTTGLNYQVYSMPGQIMRMTPERFKIMIPYILLTIPIYLAININIATSRRMKTTDNPRRDLARDVVVNILLSAGSLTLLMLIQFVGVRILGDGSMPLPVEFWDSLAYGWSFPLMMSTCAGISTYLYRKTGNIWSGLFVANFTVIPITILQCCATPIVIT